MTFSIGLKVIDEDGIEATVIDYVFDEELYIIEYDNGHQRGVSENSLNELED